MEKIYYAVIINEKPSGDHFLTTSDDFGKASKTAQEKSGKLYKFNDRPLAQGEDHRIRGILIKDYSIDI